MSGLYGEPSDEAWKAAEAVRRLNHATFAGRGGYQWPSDVDSVIAGLETLLQRIPQAMSQAGLWLTLAAEAGTAGHDDNADPTAAVLDVVHALTETTAHLQQASITLAGARTSSSHLSGIEPPVSTRADQ